MTQKRIIHLVDDEASIRRSTAFILQSSGYSVAAYSSGEAFLKAVATVEPGCVLLDIRMPGVDGLEVQRTLNSRGIAMPIIVFTGHGDISTAVQAMRGGAIDFIEKPFEKATLLASISLAFARLDDNARHTHNSHDASVRIAALTTREREVLVGLARGYPNKTIAYDLGISPRTVEVHRAKVMQKLDVRSFSDALRVAFAAGVADEMQSG